LFISQIFTWPLSYPHKSYSGSTKVASSDSSVESRAPFQLCCIVFTFFFERSKNILFRHILIGRGELAHFMRETGPENHTVIQPLLINYNMKHYLQLLISDVVLKCYSCCKLRRHIDEPQPCLKCIVFTWVTCCSLILYITNILCVVQLCFLCPIQTRPVKIISINL